QLPGRDRPNPPRFRPSHSRKKSKFFPTATRLPRPLPATWRNNAKVAIYRQRARHIVSQEFNIIPMACYCPALIPKSLKINLRVVASKSKQLRFTQGEPRGHGEARCKTSTEVIPVITASLVVEQGFPVENFHRDMQETDKRLSGSNNGYHSGRANRRIA